MRLELIIMYILCGEIYIEVSKIGNTMSTKSLVIRLYRRSGNCRGVKSLQFCSIHELF